MTHEHVWRQTDVPDSAGGHARVCDGCGDIAPGAAPSPDPVRRELREAADAWEREFGGYDGDVPRWLRRRSAALPAAPGIEGPGEGREDELRARIERLCDEAMAGPELVAEAYIPVSQIRALLPERT